MIEMKIYCSLHCLPSSVYNITGGSDDYITTIAFLFLLRTSFFNLFCYVSRKTNMVNLSRRTIEKTTYHNIESYIEFKSMPMIGFSSTVC